VTVVSESRLPAVTAPTRSELIRFDLTGGLRTAVEVLRRHLGWSGMLRVLLSYVVRGLRDPLRSLPTGSFGRRREALVRHQLRAAVLIDDALAAASGLDATAQRALLREIIRETGARFIEANVPMPTTEAWLEAPSSERDRYSGQVVQRFFNADVAELDAGETRFSFEVTACRFVQLCAALDKPHLAQLFCEADAAFFERPEPRLRLVREGTIARGAAKCDFEINFDG